MGRQIVRVAAAALLLASTVAEQRCRTEEEEEASLLQASHKDLRSRQEEAAWQDDSVDEKLQQWLVANSPPPGDNTTATCPVTGADVLREAGIYLPIRNGQKLYFSSESARRAYMKNPHKFLLDPLDGPPCSGGCPDMRGEQVTCPSSGSTFTIGMNKGYRMNHLYGQAIYFCCNGCLTSYWRDPARLWDRDKLAEMGLEIPGEDRGGPDEALVQDQESEDLSAALRGPPPGDNTTARCPVTGDNVTRADSKFYLPVRNGQRLHFASESARDAYVKNPHVFFLRPVEEAPCSGGCPDMRGEQVTCPSSGSTFTIGMNKGFRMNHRYGQAIYFCCNGCFGSYWRNPAGLWDKDKMAEMGIKDPAANQELPDDV